MLFSCGCNTSCNTFAVIQNNKRNRASANRLELPQLSSIHQCWSMDFVADQLFNGRKIRALTVVDNYSRQCLAIHVGQSLKGDDVVAVMNQLKIVHLAVPQRIQVDNGSEFISKSLDLRAYNNGVTLDFSRLGKPTDNPFIKSFNGSFRDECLNAHWFYRWKMHAKKSSIGSKNITHLGHTVHSAD